MVKERWYWVPIRVQQTGFARVRAFHAEGAREIIEDGGFEIEDCMATEIESVEITGAPVIEEQH